MIFIWPFYIFRQNKFIHIKITWKKAANEVINKNTEDFEKIVAVTKLKELKPYAKNILPNYKKWKIHNPK